jgi:predicted dehydrogenase
MNKVKIGVIGVGHLGKLHAKLYKEIDLAEIVGIYDVDNNKAELVGKELNIEVFINREQLLEKVDAVSIVTSTTNHHEAALKALDYDCHIFIEKPITVKIQEAEEVISMAKEKQKVLQVGHIERFNSALIVLSDLNLKPLFIESHRLSMFEPRGTDVAVILDLMIHDLDLILYLVKDQPDKIDASGISVISDSIDIANARIQFKNGCTANITTSRISMKKMRKMRLFQPDTYISIDLMEGFSEIYYTNGNNFNAFKDGTLALSLGEVEIKKGKKEIRYNKLQRKDWNPLKYELSGFCESILTGIPPLVSGGEGLAALRLANQVLDKIDENARLINMNK